MLPIVANKSHFNQWALPTFPPKVLRQSFEKSYLAISEHYRLFEAGARTAALKQVLEQVCRESEAAPQACQELLGA